MVLLVALTNIIGLDLVEGRSFSETDTRGSPYVAIVNQSFATHVWPHESPLGQCLRTGIDLSAPWLVPASAPCRRIVGVVNDSRIRRVRLELDPTVFQYYIPFQQVDFLPESLGAVQTWALILRATPLADGLEGKLLQETLARTPEAIFAEIRPVHLGAGLFTMFGILALGLAALGLYGALSYAASQRRREMGIRIALGAGLANIVRLIAGDGLRVVSMGVLAGLGLSMYAVRWVSSYLYQTSPQSPLVLALSIGLLLLVAGLACLVPALRAGSQQARKLTPVMEIPVRPK